MIGSNASLKSIGGLPAPKPVQAMQPSPGAQRSFSAMGQSFTPKKPQYIDINTTEDAVNNVLAQGVQEGDQRYQVKQLDRAGISRGKAQEYMASQAGQQAAGAAASQAAELRSKDDQANAKMRADYGRMLGDLDIADKMKRQAASQAAWSVQFSKQQAAADLLRHALMSAPTTWQTIPLGKKK